MINFIFLIFKEDFSMYTVDTNSLIDLVNLRAKTSPNWFESERYYNCEDFFSILQKNVRRTKKERKSHK